MKNGKKGTLAQKKLMKEAGKSPDKWLITKALNDELHVIHRETGRPAIIMI
ncbi:DUF6906 family protein [Shouchella patagoniensis]|uniref:DUF6906 family protein n=1 Tax=Shouchella patagoniensis TaxID=228576 RepID=UPI0014763A05|nr:hypothetical protein [Shouchella patagoniensis]